MEIEVVEATNGAWALLAEFATEKSRIIGGGAAGGRELDSTGVSCQGDVVAAERLSSG